METTLLTVKDLGRILNISVRTCWNWRDAGRIPMSVTIGGACRWRSDVLQNWIDQNCPDLRGATALGRG